MRQQVNYAGAGLWEFLSVLQLHVRHDVWHCLRLADRLYGEEAC